MSSSSSNSSSCPSQQSPDASRGRSSSSCRAGNSKEELEGTAELPQGDVEDVVHVDVDVDVVGMAKIPKDNSLLARFCHLPLIDSNAVIDAMHIMSVITILLMTMLTSFCQRASNHSNLQFSRRRSRWPWTVARSWRSWRRGSPPPSWLWRRTPPPSRGCWAGSDADFGLGEILRLDSSFLLPEFYNVRIGHKGQLNGIDSMQLNQSNTTLGHKGGYQKRCKIYDICYEGGGGGFLQILVRSFPGPPNTDKKTCSSNIDVRDIICLSS